MHFRTRNLLKLISDETADAILVELRKGPRTETQLVEASPTNRTATRASLRELINLEVVASGKAPHTGKKGPRRNLFQITAGDLVQFCDQADAFALALSEAQTERLRRHVSELP